MTRVLWAHRKAHSCKILATFDTKSEIFPFLERKATTLYEIQKILQFVPTCPHFGDGLWLQALVTHQNPANRKNVIQYLLIVFVSVQTKPKNGKDAEQNKINEQKDKQNNQPTNNQNNTNAVNC